MVDIVSRDAWGARAPKRRPVRMTTVPSPKVYVHHTAGNETGAAGMRSIQRFHMDTRGWNDIAYNFVIDGDTGVIYAGRGVGIKGGHVEGTENNNHGICVMGNFEREPFKPVARQALVDLLREGHEERWWHLEVYGHRNAPGAQTSCPGSNLYWQLPGIVADAGRAPTPAPPPEPLPHFEETDTMMWFAKSPRGSVLWVIPTHDPGTPLVTKGVDGDSWGPPEGSQVWDVSDAMFHWLGTFRIDT